MVVPTAPYNLTKAAGVQGFGNDTGMLTMVEGINEVIFGGWFGLLFIIAIFLVFLMSFLTTSNSPSRAFLSALFIVFALEIPLVGLNLLAPVVMMGTLILMGIGLLATFISE